MDEKLSLRKQLPKITAVAFSAFSICYLYTLITNMENASSTSAIGLIFIPFYAIFWGMVGCAIGFLAKRILIYCDWDLKRRYRSILLGSMVTFCVVAAIGYITAEIKIQQLSNLNKPRVLVNQLGFKVNNTEAPKLNAGKKSEVLWQLLGAENALTMITGELSIEVINSVMFNVVLSDKTKASYSVGDYSYLTEIEALNLTSPHFPNYLALLVRFRATSKRSMLVIFNERYELVYEQLIERCGRKENQQMRLITHNNQRTLSLSLCQPMSIVID